VKALLKDTLPELSFEEEGNRKFEAVLPREFAER